MARYTAGSTNCCNNYSFNNGCPTNHSCGSDCQCHPGGNDNILDTRQSGGSVGNNQPCPAGFTVAADGSCIPG